MTETKKNSATASHPKTAKKLIPRTAPAAVQPVAPVAPVAAPLTTTVPAAPPATARAAEKATPKPAAAKPRARKPSALDEINAKNKAAMVDALAKVQAVKIAQPLGRPLPPPELPAKARKAKAEKPGKPVKQKKPKLVRDSFAMPEAEYAQIASLKKRLGGLGQPVKKSELLRAGIAALAALNDPELQAIVGRIERIKTGRPAKAK